MKIKKIVIIISILLLIISVNSNVYAKSIWELAEGWLSVGSKQKDTVYGNGTDAKEPILDIAGILMGVGIFIAVGVGIILGIKFMLSTAEGKAEISKLLVPYLVGIVIVVGALAIWKFVINVLDV